MATRFRGTEGLIVPDQMRALDKSRLIRRLGTLDAASLHALQDVLVRMFMPQE